MYKQIYASITAIATIFLVACSNDSEGLDNQLPAEPIRLSATEITACEGSNDFGLKLLTTELSIQEEDENVVLSPFSASTAIALFSAAFDEDIATELAALMDVAPEALNSYVNTVSNRLLSLDKNTNLAIANGVWHDESERLKAEFHEIVSKYYGGNCMALPFSSDPKGSEEFVCRWLSENTNGLIKYMDTGISNTTKIFVANAIYFKGLWQEAFKKSDSKPAIFHSAGGDSEITMMHHDFKEGLSRGDNYTKITLPFGNGAFVAHFVLPDESTSPVELLQSGSLNSSAPAPQDIQHSYSLSLPRFKLDNLDQIDLLESLVRMGLKSFVGHTIDIFEHTSIAVVPKVLQKCTLEINESGAEAAAATIISGDIATNPSQHLDIVFDRPFLIFICESSTDTMLFAGRIAHL